jgi:molybdenum-dependent DNA-binding transcriptional regulator ModE
VSWLRSPVHPTNPTLEALARISHTPCGLRCASRLRPAGFDGPVACPTFLRPPKRLQRRIEGHERASRRRVRPHRATRGSCPVGTDDDGIRALPFRVGEGRVDLILAAGFDELQQADGAVDKKTVHQPETPPELRLAPIEHRQVCNFDQTSHPKRIRINRLSTAALATGVRGGETDVLPPVMRRNRETMELRQVRHAIAISEEFTFTGAARRCGISQPTITNSIKKLEYELGEPLFKRKPTAQLTSFGRQMLAQFYRLQEICDSIDAVLATRANASAET